MSVDLIAEDGGCRVRIEGELTIYAAAMILSRIREALSAHRHVFLDVGGVTEIDTAGLQLLLAATKADVPGEAEVSVVGLNPAVMECLTLLNLAQHFKFDTGATEAA